MASTLTGSSSGRRLKALVSHVVQDASVAGSPKKAQIAIIGAGGWWARSWHVPGLHQHPEADIAAIVEMDAGVRDELAEEYGCAAFGTLDDLLDSDLSVDGVLISTPHRTHFDLGMQAIAAGLNVLIEKPMTTTSEDAQTIVDAAKAAGKIFMVNTTANWREQTPAAAAMVDERKLGEIRHVQLHMGSPLMMLFDDASRKTWVDGVGKAGLNGFAWGQLSHITSWVFKVTGLRPAEVFAMMQISENSGADLSDAATIRCTNGKSRQVVPSHTGIVLENWYRLRSLQIVQRSCAARTAHQPPASFSTQLRSVRQV
jgi:predicted dehydrogenase